MRRLAVVAIVLAAGAFAPAAARATVGTGIGANPIVLATPAVAGRQYGLPQVYVVNTGTEAATYRVDVKPLHQAGRLSAPVSWVSMGRNDVVLAPKASTLVPISLAIPASARAGRYVARLVASTISRGPSATGAALGAAAATDLRFRIAGSGGWHLPSIPRALFAVPLALAVVLFARTRGLRIAFDAPKAKQRQPQRSRS